MSDPQRPATSYHQLESRNVMRSILLLTAMMFLLVALVFAGGLYFGLSGPVIAVIAAIVVVFSTFMSWYQSDRLVIAMTRAHPADPVQYAQLHNVVEEIAIAAGLPKPKVYIVDDPAPNAFATGRDPEHGVVAFTTGILQEMNRAEIEGVTAHELAHIRNRDTLVSAIAAATAGALAIISDMMFRMMIFGGGRGPAEQQQRRGQPSGWSPSWSGAILAPIAAVLLQAAISRKREALGGRDLGGVHPQPQRTALGTGEARAGQHGRQGARLVGGPRVDRVAARRELDEQALRHPPAVERPDRRAQAARGDGLKRRPPEIGCADA